MTTTTTAAQLAQLVAQLAQLAQTLAAERETAAPAPEPTRREMPERILLTVEEAAERLNIGRTKMFELIGKKKVETVQIGTRRLVPVSAIQDYAAELVHANKKIA